MVSLSFLTQLLPGSGIGAERTDEQQQQQHAEMNVPNDAHELTVSRLVVHPVKSCRGIPVSFSRYTPRGLEHDRHWAIRSSTSNKIVTARESPRLVLVVPEIDEDANVLRVTFPVETGLPGFEVVLRTNREVVEGWERLHETKIFSETLHTVLLCPSSSPSPSTPSPSEQFSTYLSQPCQFIQFPPLDYFLTDDGEQAGEQQKGRPPRVTTPPVAGPEELEYEAYPKIASTGFADKYPVLLATEESLQDVQSSISLALSPSPPAHLRNLGSTVSTSAWTDRQLQMERFRPNIVISGAGEAWAEDRWKEVEFYPSEGEIAASRSEEVGTVDERAQRPSKGKMICTSRCGRCQLPNVDPVTGEADKAVPYKIMAKYRRIDPAIKYTPCFGVNAMPQRETGMIKVGDRVVVAKLNDWEVLKVDAKE